MAYNLNPFKQAADHTFEWLKGEYVGLRAGKAAPNILDAVEVMAYGQKMHINQLATVNIEDPKTLRVSPWDKSVIKDIDSAIRESNLGLSVAVDSDGLRISFPELTADRRQGLVKVAKEKLEEARIRVRNERQKVLSDVDKNIPGDDDKTRARNDLQKLVDETNKKLEDLEAKKEREILE